MPAFLFSFDTSMHLEEFTAPNRTKIAEGSFSFHCHKGVSCFLKCCRNVDLFLFPYDIILLKNQLKIQSSEFLLKYTHLCDGSHPYFPGLQLKLREDEQRSCPFLTDEGCSVYQHRPSACRTYPLERGVEKPGHGQALIAHYFLTHHPYCQGHFEQHDYTIRQWEREQMLHECNLYNDSWAELDAFFATNPWAGEGSGGPRQQLAFMVCYNIDAFRQYVEQHNILNHFKITKADKRRISCDDGALLRFGFNWLEFILGGRNTLIKK